ncbi:MAG TPA: Asp-tRNA(Asn)/Glu-tRNA(Gln) amidotransferase subunit GatA [Chitinophagales bacterium]|nr:Asp-tRNA(Asn)/Glu-tRNA(Gln) amidotransferase subunit GatA [Chitinophagales bacterium]
MKPTLRQIQADIKSGATSCEKLVADYLQKIEANKHLNAYLEVYDKEATERAKQLDKKLADGAATGKLFGCVIAIKDNICYKQHKVSAGSKILEGFTSLYNATVVDKLLAEDAIIIGRTNCDEFAMGSSNENSAYGPVLNAQDNSRVPGGSSGGSAVVVQADLCHASLGSDTGGSIRQPASFCGIVGIKPTYGRVSRYGLIAYASSFDQIGPFTHSVEDMALLMEVISGKDTHDATSSSVAVTPYSQQLNFDKKARIAVFPSTMNSEGLNSEVKGAMENVLNDLKADGHTVEEVGFDLLEYLIATYYVLSTAEASSNLARFDGIHYGYRSKNLEEKVETEESKKKTDKTDIVYRRSRTEGFGKEVKNRIMLGTFVLSSGYYDAYYSRAQKVRRILTDKIRGIFNDYDFIIMPTSPTVAFKFGEKTDNPVEMYLADIYTVLANLTGIPAISLPVAEDKNGLPIGVQVLADKFQESKLLAFSEKLMQIESPK